MRKWLTIVLTVCFILTIGAYCVFSFLHWNRNAASALPSVEETISLETIETTTVQNEPILTGWQVIDDKTYYYDDTGAFVTGWLELDGDRYYLDDSGVMMTGWGETENGRIYLGEDGTVTAGWLELDGEHYYMDSAGIMLTGWLQQDNGRYYLNSDGTMAAGWLDDQGERYYLHQNGVMAVGEVVIDGTSHFFTSAGKAVILVNRWNPVPDGYEPELVPFENFSIDLSCKDALEQMLNDCTAAGYAYHINAAYRSVSTQQSLWDRRYRYYIDSGYSAAEAYQMVAEKVALPGTSEHQLGLAVDIDGTDATLNWLAEHCWQYGFILHYPDGKSEQTGIAYEPWHFAMLVPNWLKNCTSWICAWKNTCKC